MPYPPEAPVANPYGGNTGSREASTPLTVLIELQLLTQQCCGGDLRALVRPFNMGFTNSDYQSHGRDAFLLAIGAARFVRQRMLPIAIVPTPNRTGTTMTVLAMDADLGSQVAAVWMVHAAGG
jgi:hypothetical protein